MYVLFAKGCNFVIIWTLTHNQTIPGQLSVICYHLRFLELPISRTNLGSSGGSPRNRDSTVIQECLFAFTAIGLCSIGYDQTCAHSRLRRNGLPLQSWTLHGCCSVSGPSAEQFFPPKRDLLQVRLRVFRPPPHDAEHVVKGLQNDIVAFSENKFKPKKVTIRIQNLGSWVKRQNWTSPWPVSDNALKWRFGLHINKNNKKILNTCSAHFNMTWWSNAQIELEFGVLVFVEGGNRRAGEKPSEQEREPTTNSTRPHTTTGQGIETGTQWREASALTTEPSLHPQHIITDLATYHIALT